ncbi:hypothetical protein K9K85_00495 [Patescibacteria group bacterium]|nr:hypothetical protein [Patescibacteria group bacterium]
MEKNKKQETLDSSYGRLLLQWDFKEEGRKKRDFKWYFFVFFILGGIFVYSFLTGNFLFSLFLVLFIIVILSPRITPDQELSFTIFEDGILLGEKKFYDWKSIKNFHLVYDPPRVKKLYFDLENIFLSDLSIPLEGQDPSEVRELLNSYLEEDLERSYETLMDRLNRWLKL